MSRKADKPCAGAADAHPAEEKPRLASSCLYFFLLHASMLCFLSKLCNNQTVELEDICRPHLCRLWPVPGPADVRPGSITPRSHTLTQITHEVLTALSRRAASALLAEKIHHWQNSQRLNTVSCLATNFGMREGWSQSPRTSAVMSPSRKSYTLAGEDNGVGQSTFLIPGFSGNRNGSGSALPSRSFI